MKNQHGDRILNPSSSSSSTSLADGHQQHSLLQHRRNSQTSQKAPSPGGIPRPTQSASDSKILPGGGGGRRTKKHLHQRANKSSSKLDHSVTHHHHQPTSTSSLISSRRRLTFNNTDDSSSNEPSSITATSPPSSSMNFETHHNENSVESISSTTSSSGSKKHPGTVSCSQTPSSTITTTAPSIPAAPLSLRKQIALAVQLSIDEFFDNSLGECKSRSNSPKSSLSTIGVTTTSTTTPSSSLSSSVLNVGNNKLNLSDSDSSSSSGCFSALSNQLHELQDHQESFGGGSSSSLLLPTSSTAPRKIFRNNKGETELHLAAIRGDFGRLEHLLQKRKPQSGASSLSAEYDINIQDFAGWTALHEACNRGHTQAVRVLVNHGADVNVAASCGTTPLIDAAANGHLTIVKLLLKHGADPLKANKRGQTALDLALNEQVEELLGGGGHHHRDKSKTQTPTRKKPPVVVNSGSNELPLPTINITTTACTTTTTAELTPPKLQEDIDTKSNFVANKNICEMSTSGSNHSAVIMTTTASGTGTASFSTPSTATVTTNLTVVTSAVVSSSGGTTVSTANINNVQSNNNNLNPVSISNSVPTSQSSSTTLSSSVSAESSNSKKPDSAELQSSQKIGKDAVMIVTDAKSTTENTKELSAVKSMENKQEDVKIGLGPPDGNKSVTGTETTSPAASGLSTDSVSNTPTTKDPSTPGHQLRGRKRRRSGGTDNGKKSKDPKNKKSVSQQPEHTGVENMDTSTKDSDCSAKDDDHDKHHQHHHQRTGKDGDSTGSLSPHSSAPNSNEQMRVPPIRIVLPTSSGSAERGLSGSGPGSGMVVITSTGATGLATSTNAGGGSNNSNNQSGATQSEGFGTGSGSGGHQYLSVHHQKYPYVVTTTGGTADQATEQSNEQQTDSAVSTTAIAATATSTPTTTTASSTSHRITRSSQRVAQQQHHGKHHHHHHDDNDSVSTGTRKKKNRGAGAAAASNSGGGLSGSGGSNSANLNNSNSLSSSAASNYLTGNSSAGGANDVAGNNNGNGDNNGAAEDGTGTGLDDAAANGGATMNVNVYQYLPDRSSYRMFMSIRDHVRRRRQNMPPPTVLNEAKQPPGFQDYLSIRGEYLLRDSDKQPTHIVQAKPPSALANGSPLYKLFLEQEQERHQLRLRHHVEQEKLILAYEQERVRLHSRAEMCKKNQTLPLSVCTYLKDEELYNKLELETDHSNDNVIIAQIKAENPFFLNDGPSALTGCGRTRYNGRVLISWVRDDDDKWNKVKTEMLDRHRAEAEALHGIQRLRWEWKMAELEPEPGTNAAASGLHHSFQIDENFVPVVQIVKDLELKSV